MQYFNLVNIGDGGLANPVTGKERKKQIFSEKNYLNSVSKNEKYSLVAILILSC